MGVPGFEPWKTSDQRERSLSLVHNPGGPIATLNLTRVLLSPRAEVNPLQRRVRFGGGRCEFSGFRPISTDVQRVRSLLSKQGITWMVGENLKIESEFLVGTGVFEPDY